MKLLRLLRVGLLLSGILIVILLLLLYFTTRGPYRDVAIDITNPSKSSWGKISQLKVGVGVQDITPDLTRYDTWIDVDGDSSFNPKIDKYEDKNNNGKFDFVWLAGFNNSRPAQGVNDPLWSRSIAFRNNGVTIVLVSIDSVGITHERYLGIRERIKGLRNDINLISFASTHTHSAPDTLGLWSYKEFIGRKFDHDYMAFMEEKIIASVIDAVDSLTPAKTIIAEAKVPIENFSFDSRPPFIVDQKMPLALFKNLRTDETIATLASWGMHPEGFGPKFTKISSDFVHYFREAMEHGLDGKSDFKGFGGKSIFFTGPGGGLMTQLDIYITDRFGIKHGHEGKSKAQGENLAILAYQALKEQTVKKQGNMDFQGIAFSAKTIYLPIGWPLKAAVALGLVHPGLYELPFKTKIKTEINAIRIGEIEIITSPGEMFPEIIDGGIESPLGADIKTDPIEIPPLRQLMKGKINMNFNLGMDEIGYVIPITQWDRKKPYTYSYEEAPYGEIYIGDPNASPELYKESVMLLERLHNTIGPHDYEK